MLTIATYSPTQEDVYNKTKNRVSGGYMVISIKRNSLQSSIDIFRETKQFWNSDEMNRKLKYQVFVLNDENKLLLAVSSNDIFELEDNPKKFVKNVSDIFYRLVVSEEIKLSKKPEIIFCRNKLSGQMYWDKNTINLVNNLNDIVDDCGFKFADFLIVQPSAYTSYRDSKLSL